MRKSAKMRLRSSIGTGAAAIMRAHRRRLPRTTDAEASRKIRPTHARWAAETLSGRPYSFRYGQKHRGALTRHFSNPPAAYHQVAVIKHHSLARCDGALRLVEGHT